MRDYKLIKKIIITGKIRLLTGLHIGAANSQMDIGGIDSAVVRNPINNEPYIPGSSLKGKMRSLIELTDGTIGEKPMGQVYYTVTNEAQHRAAKLFGSAKNKRPGQSPEEDSQRPSRLIVRDAELLTKDFDSDLPYTEVKTEVTIDRITARAMPRTLERVPAGAEFKLDMILNIFNEDNEEELLSTLSEAMKLLEYDYLGGSGSRGYGQIKFVIDPENDIQVVNLSKDNPGLSLEKIKEYFQNFVENEA